MPLVIPNGYQMALYRLSLTNDPEPILISCGHKINAAPDADADALHDNFYESWKNRLSAAYALEEVSVKQVTTGGAELEGTHVEHQVGLYAGGILPQNCATLVKKVTGQSGRHNRGRCFIPGAINRDNVGGNGVLTATELGLQQAAANTWRLACVSDSLDMVILHSSGPSAATPVTALVVDAKIATQRRRLRP